MVQEKEEKEKVRSYKRKEEEKIKEGTQKKNII